MDTGFCKTKEFLAGITAVSIPCLILFAGVIFPMINQNVDAINENSVEIVKVDTTLLNLNESIDKLDVTVTKLDDGLDKINIVLCDLSKGSHC